MGLCSPAGVMLTQVGIVPFRTAVAIQSLHGRDWPNWLILLGQSVDQSLIACTFRHFLQSSCYVDTAVGFMMHAGTENCEGHADACQLLDRNVMRGSALGRACSRPPPKHRHRPWVPQPIPSRPSRYEWTIAGCDLRMEPWTL